MNARAKEIVAAVREELEQNADEKTRESSYRFFKEEVVFHGVKAGTARVVVGLFCVAQCVMHRSPPH